MHKFMICFNEQNNKSREYAGLLMEAFASFMQYDPAHPDLVISVGGDRTMLDTIQAYVGQIETTYFVGLHTGNLGFYSDYKEDEWERLVEDVKYHIMKLPDEIFWRSVSMAPHHKSIWHSMRSAWNKIGIRWCWMS